VSQRNAPERRSFWRVGPESTWTTVLPVAFIIISLLSLVILPIVVSSRTARMRSEISRVAEPARRAANQIQVDLSAEVDNINAFHVTGQTQYRDAYNELVARQYRNRAILLKLAPRLSSDFETDVQRLFSQATRWHQGVQRNELLARQLPAEVFMTRLFEQHPAYQKSLEAASELELELQAGIEDRLRQIRETERWNFSLTIILTLLALTSALLVAGLGRQARLLAGEAMRRRQEAEREAAEAMRAREAAEVQERRSAFLAAAGQELGGSLDYDETIATLARLIVPNLAEMCAIELVEQDGSWRRAAVAHRDARTETTLQHRDDVIRHDVPEALVRILQERQPRLVGANSGLFDYVGGLEQGQTMLVAPLVSRGQALGVILAVAPVTRPFHTDDLSLISDLARHASLSIDNAGLYQSSQQAVSAREQVLAIVSHDLRNPLNAVTLGASLLQMSESISDDDREQIDTISLSAKRMARLIEDLLDVTRLEGGKRLPIQREKVEVAALIRDTFELFKAQAATSSITLRKFAADALPPVFADLHRVMQVFSNLIGNAMKFTPPGGIISVRAEPTLDSEVLFTVADTGPGIPAEHLQSIFNPYWQGKRTERMGAGLGLAITRGIVESHGGRIWVESEVGKGTQFYFTLPAHRSAPVDAPTSTEESAARR
jgi:signal transduction histidine kinase